MAAHDKPVGSAKPKRAKQAKTPLWQRLVEIGQSVPIEEWQKLPNDHSINLDHYLYGSPKRVE